jgi:DNA helicase HerA-like ATPase
MSTPLLIARTLEKELYLLPAMANRHGLITGATGTGKTVTLQKLAESLSEIGVPVFMADVKGDLTGVAQEGTASEKLLERLKNIGITDWTPHNNPVVVWDIFGEKATRCAPPSPISARCCWPVCLTSTTCSPAC